MRLTGVAPLLAMLGWAAALGLLAGPAAQAGGWPNAVPAQPLVQADRHCAPNIVYLSRRCRVIDFAPVGKTAEDGKTWYYAFYDTHWADRHGHMDRAFPVIFYLQQPATLRLGLWINDEPGLADRWARTPALRPVLIARPEASYLGFTLKAVAGADDQRLFRRNEPANAKNRKMWKEVDILHRSDADRAKLAAALPHGCEAADDGFYMWDSFRLIVALRQTFTAAPCGYELADLIVRDDRLVLTGVTYHREEPRPRPVPPASGAPALTPEAAAPTSAER